ncbi:glycosyltransferase family 2 protein [Staphylococcus equorum]|uniref:Putative glycosyltransferase TagX n=1 Tax=Staphylococcus equorum TaxID=246432 RepID=A0A9X4LC62_9STAP|nr:glycosyltransferase family 2 protein [Staphylococcus equorum]MDG0860376.1 glycosyltransferase [Staphylococcus equorum]
MFSVIIPVHNSEKTIEDTLVNILDESPHFEDEIIIVNDGSTDGTNDILNKFKSNTKVKIINQSNQGVSSARNTALENLSEQSEFVIFVDDSDYLGENFFEYALDYFKKNKEIDIAVTPMTIIENEQRKSNNLNYKFDTQYDVIDIMKDFQSIHYHIGGVIFRKKLFARDYYRFDESISYWEDAKLINSIFIEKQYYGLIKKATYFYNRNDGFSLSHTAWNSSKRYSHQIEANYFQLIRDSIRKYGRNLEYVQFLLANHFLEYVREHNQTKINYKFLLEDVEFSLNSKKMFRYISVNTIDKLKAPNSSKNYLYYLKDTPFPYYRYFDKINLYIQHYDFSKRELLFSFSPEAYGIPANSTIHFSKNSNEYLKATLHSEKFFVILGTQFDDFSRNIYKVKLSLRKLLFGCNIIIVVKNLNKVVRIKNPSIATRLFKKVRLNKKISKNKYL